MKTEVDSIIIVKAYDFVNKKGIAIETGYTATMRFSNPRKDRIISATTKPTMYKLVDRYVKEVTSE